MEQTRKQAGRRAFLKVGGLVAASGVFGSAWAFMTGVGPKSNTRRRSFWIKVVNRPTLGERNADYKRFSGFDMFALYRPLKTQHDGAGSVEAEQADKNKRLAHWTKEKKPGFSLADRQLGEGGFTVMRSTTPGIGLLSWTRVAVHTPGELGTQRYSASPEEMANTVKVAARLYGAGLVGIAPMNEAYVNLQVPHRDQPRKEQPPRIHRRVTSMRALEDMRMTIIPANTR